jgi:hypothetical protein
MSINNIGLLTPTLIAQSGLALLAAKYPVIGSIATDFSSQQIPYGASIVTKIPTVGALQSYSSVSGYAPSAINSTDVTVSMNNHVYSALSLNDQELTEISPLLFSQYANSFAVAIGEGVMSSISNLFITGNYTYTPTAQALTGVSRTTIIQAETQLNARNVPKDGRFAVLNSYAYGQLLQDPSLVSTFFVPGGPGVAGQTLPQINGITITEYSALPSTNYLQGVVGSRDSLAFVSRVPMDPSVLSVPLVGNITVVTDPVSKLSVQVRDWYDFGLGQHKVAYTLMYGVTVANPKSLQLITTQ